MSEVPYKGVSYCADIQTMDPDLACQCSDCGWEGCFGDLSAIGDCVLKPGDPSPAGRCPDCATLAYVADQPAEEANEGIATGFDSAIADAENPEHENYSPFLAQRIRAERRMCTALVEACLERGYLISVFDGEDWPLKRSADKARIMAVLFSTDEDTIVLRKASTAGYRGRFQLVYGNNGWDVVSDFDATKACSEIWGEVLNPLSDKIEASMVKED